MSHAPAAPSAFHITVPCPGSLQLQALMPEMPETEEQKEGSAAHYVATSMASGYPWNIGDKFEYAGEQWECTVDFYNGAKLFDRVCDAPGFGALRIEDTVTIPRIDGTRCWGTPDAWKFNPDTYTVHLYEYKYGHRFVDAFENYQNCGYAEGVIDKLGLDDQRLTVEINIIQPRNYHKDGPARQWKVRGDRIRGVVNVIHHSVQQAFQSVPPTNTGPHCLDCKARQLCVTYRQQQDALIDFSGTAELVDLPDEVLGAELHTVREAIERLQGRETGLAQQAEAALRKGRLVPFFGLESVSSKLVLRDDVNVAEFAEMASLMGVNVMAPAKPFTPKQCMDLGLDESVMALYSYRKPGAMKLTATDNTAKKVFGK